MTPKSLLRHPLVSSPLRAFSRGRLAAGHRPSAAAPPAKPARAGPAETIRRLMLCSGKVYVDLVTSELPAAAPRGGHCAGGAAGALPAGGSAGAAGALPDAGRGAAGCRKNRRTWAPGSSSGPTWKKPPAGTCPLRLVARPRSRQPGGRLEQPAHLQPEAPGRTGLRAAKQTRSSEENKPRRRKRSAEGEER